MTNEFDGRAANAVQAGTVHGGIHINRSHHGFPPPRQLPLNVPGFVNRTESLRALDALLAGASERPGEPPPAVVSAIAGAPGVGKTALAVHWAHHRRSHFPDGDLYVDLRGYGPGPPLTAERALDGFLRALDIPPAAIPQDVDQKAALYRSLLAGKRVLVVIENLRGNPRLQAGEESDPCGAGQGQAIRRQANRRLERTRDS